ncbi:MAG: SpoIID/LytB domain-containing protein [Acidobacteria bacterium]|nr:MAG: SpoIID/LytB domain-containing protein [Acidobacteriota bacterium]
MRRRSLLLFLVASLLLPILVSCGGKKRPPPLPPSSQPSPKKTGRPVSKKPSGPPLKPRAEEGPRIRLLLRENFSSFTVRGSTLAPLLTARAKNGKIILRKSEDESGEILGTGTGFSLVSADPSKLLVLDGSPYRGTIEIFVNPLSAPVAVNEVDLEEYLRGTVPNELHPSRFQQIEALKAQTVAARTFAFYHLGLNVKRGFDVYADERSQVYSGAKVEHPLSDQAIAETSGVIVTYDGKPILSVYSSTCGGKTESYAGMFRRDLPYLKGGVECSDEISPFHSWEANCAGSKIESALNRRAAFGHLRKIETLKRGVSGRIIEMKLTGTKGEAVLRGNEIRYTFGIRSTLIEHLDTGKDRDGNITEIRVKGKGWGHGVGLCQFGAVHLATKGFDYERILRHYYHDIDLKGNH